MSSVSGALKRLYFTKSATVLLCLHTHSARARFASAQRLRFSREPGISNSAQRPIWMLSRTSATHRLQRHIRHYLGSVMTLSFPASLSALRGYCGHRAI